MPDFKPLRLSCFDAADSVILSGLLQDAFTASGQIIYHQQRRQLDIGLERFCWEYPPRFLGSAFLGRLLKGGYRVQSLLQIRTVLQVQYQGFDPATEGFLNLLAFVIRPSKDAFRLELIGAGHKSISFRLEAIDLHLRDVGSLRAVRHRPRHALSGSIDAFKKD